MDMEDIGDTVVSLLEEERERLIEVWSTSGHRPAINIPVIVRSITQKLQDRKEEFFDWRMSPENQEVFENFRLTLTDFFDQEEDKGHEFVGKTVSEVSHKMWKDKWHIVVHVKESEVDPETRREICKDYFIHKGETASLETLFGSFSEKGQRKPFVFFKVETENPSQSSTEPQGGKIIRNIHVEYLSS